MMEVLADVGSIVAQNGGSAAPAIPPDSGKAIGVGLAVGLAAYGSGVAERGIGAAAVGGLAEDSIGIGYALVMTVLPETLVLLALVLAFVV